MKSYGNMTTPPDEVKPANAAEARRLLVEGNLSFARYLNPQRASGETVRHVFSVSAFDLGVSAEPGKFPPQQPFAAFLSCADARVPNVKT